MSLIIDFCGEEFTPPTDGSFFIGREGDLAIDDNEFLHRRFLRVTWREDLWMLANVGSRLTATVADADGFSQAWLAPGAEVPLVFAHTSVRFTAGQTAYEIDFLLSSPIFTGVQREAAGTGTTTRGMVTLTPSQRLLIVALAEPVLRAGKSVASLPSSADAARRLGWTQTKFNRKLDNVCEKLTATGVRGLHGSAGRLATGRRARLVEYATSMRIVTVEDLPLLDLPHKDD
jgi:hypothetical protein